MRNRQYRSCYFGTPTLAILAALALSACSSGFSGHTPITITHYGFPITLSREHPTDADIGVTLVSIRADGTTTLRILSSGRLIRAVPGDCFTPSPEFGPSGLCLTRASRATGVALIERMTAE